MALFYLKKEGIVTVEREGDVVVLSPSLYWYAHAEFPTRSLARAKRLADAFMDSRPEGYDAIHVERKGGGYDCYAYDEEALARRLEEAEGARNAPRYFLQQFVGQMPLRIDDRLVADDLNGIVVELRDESRSLPTLASLDVAKVAKPFNRSTESGLPNRLLAALVAVAAVTMVADLGVRVQKYMAVEKALERTQTDRSLYEIRAMVKRYEKRAAEQSRLRESVRKALAGRLKRLECTPQKGCRGE